MEGKKPPVQLTAGSFKDTGFYLTSALFQYTDAFAGDPGGRINRTYNHTGYAHPDNKIRAWWGIAMMGTGLQINIKRRLLQKIPVPDGPYGIRFGMGLPEKLMVPFPDDPALMNHHRTYHGIGGGIAGSKFSKLQTTLHIFFVRLHASVTTNLLFLNLLIPDIDE
jgi:hypothetical protein